MTTKTPTQASQIRLSYAQEIAASCPDFLFSEIALTGSSARGLANEDSDIEINLWLEKMPSLKPRAKWLIDFGVKNIIVEKEPRSDGSRWIQARYKGIELEVGWQTFADLEMSLNELLQAQTTDNKKLRLAELVLSAKSLRGSSILSHWQAILQNYPQALADKLIADTLSQWLNEENWLETHDFEADMVRIYRILFALNHRWEINWKWVHYVLPELKIAPVNFQRFVGIQENEIQLNLILETLALIKHDFPQRNAAITMFQNVQKQ